MNSPPNLPLDGVRVVDFSQVQFGPMVTQIMADFGADVIKVERPGLGDISRSIDVKSDGLEDSAPFMALNRNKRSIALDLKQPEASTVMDRLLEQADVLVMNFRAGVAERMGLGYEELHARFPSLIYASGTGFGPSGPLMNLGGQDMALQSIAGATWHNRDSDGRPSIYPIPFVDFGAGMALTQGILLALIQRQASGNGQRVDVSLLDTALFEQMQELTAWMMRRFEIHWERDNLVGAFKTSDGWVTVVGLFRPDPLEAVCTALDMPNLTEREEFATSQAQQANRAQLWEILDEHIGQCTTDEVVERLSDAGVLCAPVLDYDQVLDHPQVQHNQAVRTVEHPQLGSVRVIDNPIRLSSVDSHPYQAAPTMGEDTTSVLEELGYDDADIDSLAKAGVISSDSATSKAE